MKEHCDGTATLAGEFAGEFGAAEQGRLAGLGHDIGKFTTEYQDRLLNGGKKVDHSAAGAFECVKLRQTPAAFCIAGHHGGLPDMGERDDQDGGTLFGKLNRAKNGKIPDYRNWQREITLFSPAIPDFCREPSGGMFFTRMLYSCLVDADYLDTERFMLGTDAGRGVGDSIEELNRRLDGYTKDWFPPKCELNEKRCRILDACIRGGQGKSGIYTLTVPTGGGKTVSSLAFALRHAKAYGKRRVIYVIPYTSIIEQTAGEFRKILGERNVLEHHSNYDPEDSDIMTKEKLRIAKATENWDAPVVVTTAVQFFESLHGDKSSKCRKLHNIANSVVIFDEAQMIPIPYLRPCVSSIVQLVRHYGVTAVLCTATQPALGRIIREFWPEYETMELCPAELSADHVFRRTKISRAGKLEWETVGEMLNSNSQILCVVNSRRGAKKAYSYINEEGKFHLSTLMTPQDREAALKEIRRRLDEGKPCRVVSTSLIEAGVDVDFPVVLREEAGLDSVLQAAGRCNREGKNPIEESVVTVFQSPDKTPPLFSQQTGVFTLTANRYDDLFSPEAIRFYFTELLDLKGDQATDKSGVMKLINSGRYPFRTLAEVFHLIDQNTFTVYIPIDGGAELMERYRYGERSRALFRSLGKFGVNIYENHLKALYSAGDVEAIEGGAFVLKNLSLYSRETGLSLDADVGKADFI